MGEILDGQQDYNGQEVEHVVDRGTGERAAELVAVRDLAHGHCMRGCDEHVKFVRNVAFLSSIFSNPFSEPIANV